MNPATDMHAAQLLWLMQLASPALPVGGFSYSEGLEAAVEHGWVNDEHSACEWLLDQLHLVQSEHQTHWRGETLTKLVQGELS